MLSSIPLKVLYYGQTVLIDRSSVLQTRRYMSTSGHINSCTTISFFYMYVYIYKTKQTPWPESARKLYRPSDRRLSSKLVPTFADRGVSRSQRGLSPTAVISIF
jgi:hypothetical protein